MLSLVQTPLSARRAAPLDRTQLGAEWLLDSGICRPGFGIAEEYRTDGREYAPVSKRATAHYVRTLLWLFETRGETRYIDRALTAAQYLSRSSWDVSGFALTGGMVAHDQSAHRRFDESGAVLRALIESWQASQHSEFLTKAIECANGMQRIPGACPLESAQGWLDLAEATGNAQWQEIYDRALASGLRLYREFPEPRNGERTMLWVVRSTAACTPSSADLTRRCCFLEALLTSPKRRGNQSCEALQTFQRVFELTSKELRSRNQAPTEAYARMLRLRLHAAGMGLIKLDVHQAEREAGLIREMQADHYDARIRGGFYTGRPSSAFARVVGLTTTAVSLQALEQWEQYQDGCLRPALPLV